MSTPPSAESHGLRSGRAQHVRRRLGRLVRSRLARSHRVVDLVEHAGESSSSDAPSQPSTWRGRRARRSPPSPRAERGPGDRQLRHGRPDALGDPAAGRRARGCDRARGPGTRATRGASRSGRGARFARGRTRRSAAPSPSGSRRSPPVPWAAAQGDRSPGPAGEATAAAARSRRGGSPRNGRAARGRSWRPRSTEPCPRRARPSSPTESSTAVPVIQSGQWNWYRSIRSRPRPRRLRSHSSRIDSGRRSFSITPSGALPPPTALREHEHVLADAIRGERAADDLLGVPKPVHRSGVDPVHAVLDRVTDRGHRLVVVDFAPAEPPRAADRPGAEADGRQFPGPSPRDVVSSPARPAVVVEVVAPRARGAHPSSRCAFADEIADASSRSTGLNSMPPPP